MELKNKKGIANGSATDFILESVDQKELLPCRLAVKEVKSIRKWEAVTLA